MIFDWIFRTLSLYPSFPRIALCAQHANELSGTYENNSSLVYNDRKKPCHFAPPSYRGSCTEDCHTSQAFSRISLPCTFHPSKKNKGYVSGNIAQVFFSSPLSNSMSLSSPNPPIISADRLVLKTSSMNILK